MRRHGNSESFTRRINLHGVALRKRQHLAESCDFFRETLIIIPEDERLRFTYARQFIQDIRWEKSVNIQASEKTVEGTIASLDKPEAQPPNS